MKINFLFPIDCISSKKYWQKPAAKLKMTVRDRTSSVLSSNLVVIVHETVSRKPHALDNNTAITRRSGFLERVNQELRHGELASVY
jgi:hypothetical protein